MQRQTAVTAQLASKQLQLFAIAPRYCNSILLNLESTVWIGLKKITRKLKFVLGMILRRWHVFKEKYLIFTETP